MKTLIKILFLFLPVLLTGQDIKKVSGVTDTNIKKVSGVSDTNIKKVSGVTLATFTGILDDYPGAGAAYSVRKLDKDYTGNCMRIKRLSDNTTLDVGFTTSGDLDESAITTFCTGSVDATVTIWYDQSGNGFNVTPVAGNNSLLICDNGVVVKKNGKPAIVMTTDEFTTATISVSSFMGTNAFYMIGTFTYVSNGGLGSMICFTSDFQLSAPGIGNILIDLNPTGAVSSFASYVHAGSFTETDNTQYIFEYGLISSTNGLLYVDGTDVETTDATASFTPSGTSELILGGSSQSYPCGSMQELILYPSNQSSNRSAIYTNVAAYF